MLTQTTDLVSPYSATVNLFNKKVECWRLALVETWTKENGKNLDADSLIWCLKRGGPLIVSNVQAHSAIETPEFSP